MIRRSVAGLLATVVLLLGTGAATADSGAVGAPTDPGPVYKTVTDKSAKLSLQTYGRPDGKDMVFRISGSVYANVEGNSLSPELQHGQKLFNIEGYNIRRLYRVPAGSSITYTITWDRKPSAARCATPPAGSARAGTYLVEAKVPGHDRLRTSFVLEAA